jgi:hypothetical protein
METIDKQHSNMIAEFKHNELILIPEYKRIMEMSNTPPDMVQDYKNKIYRLERLKRNYLLDNSKHIFSYYEEKQEKKAIKTTTFFNTNKQPVNDYDNCEICSGEIVYDEELGRLICRGCSRSIISISSEYTTHYNEPIAEYNYAYKRISHFKEIILQFQAKENTLIKDFIFVKIKNEIQKQRLEIDELNVDNIKGVLKKLKIKNLYEHINFVLEKLGVPAPVFSVELEERLCFLFQQIQTPYAMVCTDERSNFLNYHFVLAKLLELCDETEYLPLLSIIKDDSKLAEHNKIWKSICIKLGWV